MTEIESGTVAVVLTSPPYNIGKPYGQRMALADYIVWCKEWLGEMRRTLASNGAAWINLGFVEVPGQGRAVPLSYLLWPYLGLYLLQEVVWRYENGVACRRRLSPRNEKLLWLVRDPDSYTFDLDAIRDPDVRYPTQTRTVDFAATPGARTPATSGSCPRSPQEGHPRNELLIPRRCHLRSPSASSSPAPGQATWFSTRSQDPAPPSLQP
jgi:adenine-specific DNA-methyltransferase